MDYLKLDLWVIQRDTTPREQSARQQPTALKRRRPTDCLATMGAPDAADATLQARKEAAQLKRLSVATGESVGPAGDGADAPLASPTWTDRDDRSGRTETTSVASDDGREGGDEEDDEDDGEEGGPRAGGGVEGGAEAARGFRELLRSMQYQLAFLQSMTHKIAQDERSVQERNAGEDGAAARRGLGLGAAASGCTAASPKTCPSMGVTCELLSLETVDTPPEPEAECAVSLDASSRETRALQVEVRRLRAELDAAQQENARLASVVQRLEAGRSEEAAGSRDASNEYQASIPVEHTGCGVPVAVAESVGNVFLDATAPQWLDGHEQCQQRTHELWATVRTLALYVQTYALEKRSMREQRDEAVCEAERAWAENAALAGSRNPQQRIKYLQQLKADNGALRSRIRELQTQLVSLSVSALGAASPPSPREASASPSEEMAAPASPTSSPTASSSPDRRRSVSPSTLLAAADDRFERERNRVLQRMWRRQEALRAQLERLQRQTPAPDTETPPRAVTSPARSSSGRPPSPPAAAAALPSGPSAASAARAERKDARRPRAFDAAAAPIAHAPC